MNTNSARQVRAISSGDSARMREQIAFSARRGALLRSRTEKDGARLLSAALGEKDGLVELGCVAVELRRQPLKKLLGAAQDIAHSILTRSVRALQNVGKKATMERPCLSAQSDASVAQLAAACSPLVRENKTCRRSSAYAAHAYPRKRLQAPQRPAIPASEPSHEPAAPPSWTRAPLLLHSTSASL